MLPHCARVGADRWKRQPVDGLAYAQVETLAVDPDQAGLRFGRQPCTVDVMGNRRGVIVDRDGAARLRRGQPLILRGRDAPHEGWAYAACMGVPVAFGEVIEGALEPSRVFNLPI